MLARVRRTIRERALLEPGARVLVGCSGGPDSAALLHVLGRLDDLRLELFAASVDHGLRPDAGGDVEVARGLAERLGVPFTALAVEVSREGASVQARARSARYAALLDHARRLGAKLAVGHTLDDQAETVLARLLRGAGLHGIAGIEPVRADGVVRPLIDCRRDEILAHVARFDLPTVEDPSNADPRFLRSRLRHQLLPAMLTEDPNVAVHLARLADEAREIGALIDSSALEAGEELAGLPRPVRLRAMAIWIEGLTGLKAKRAHLELLESGADVLLSGGWVASFRGDRLTARREPELDTRSSHSERMNAAQPRHDGKKTENRALRAASPASDD